MTITLNDVTNCLLLVVAVAPVVVVTVYASARAWAFAFFRTKREHLRKVLSALKDGEDNA